jgi:hypothetical protein
MLDDKSAYYKRNETSEENQFVGRIGLQIWNYGMRWIAQNFNKKIDHKKGQP